MKRKMRVGNFQQIHSESGRGPYGKVNYVECPNCHERIALPNKLTDNIKIAFCFDCLTIIPLAFAYPSMQEDLDELKKATDICNKVLCEYERAMSAFTHSSNIRILAESKKILEQFLQKELKKQIEQKNE